MYYPSHQFLRAGPCVSCGNLRLRPVMFKGYHRVDSVLTFNGCKDILPTRIVDYILIRISSNGVTVLGASTVVAQPFVNL